VRWEELCWWSIDEDCFGIHVADNWHKRDVPEVVCSVLGPSTENSGT
jgi:hypothetical protein